MRKNFFSFPYHKILFRSLFFFFGLEIVFHLLPIPSILFRLQDKRLHCLKNLSPFSDPIPWMRLCPNESITLYHPDKDILYKVTTDPNGERVTGTAQTSNRIEETWILGDSVAMGYLVSNEESLPWILQSNLEKKNLNRKVRNLGVDAVGSFGIQERLEEVLEISPAPKEAYWIYHISDFTDSYREEELKVSFKKRTLVRISYALSKYSAVFNGLKILYEKYKPESAENLVIPSSGSVLGPDHPHRKALISLFEYTKKKKIPLTLVFLPEPSASYAPVADSALVKEVRQIALDSKIRVLDLQQPIYKFWEEGKKQIFLPKDGHPNPSLYRFISSEIEKDIISH
ncbi:LA_2486 family SGNH/GDSL-type esterase [Leptospira sarikeiensis]|uniref:SGNH/GDSL hydrolase family protein n=1 Tax=Leptospira sarikeiensis TaxID=2484943 RepID=A0A4R9K0F1_9LEPT|nr:SGNH/GDSL hydrolase family protein [Leptospira sarikeiensis]TGL58491.1 SGNH/GDSL hydrolase family protein [Leptospira sarikeiensis]